jgi:hypothetical protein
MRRVLVDDIKSVAIRNGLLRVDCLVTGRDKERPSSTLLSPGNQAKPILKALTQAIQELEIKIRQRVQQRG